MANVYDIVIRPIITERSMASVADKKYVFEVAKDGETDSMTRCPFSNPACVLKRRKSLPTAMVPEVRTNA